MNGNRFLSAALVLGIALAGIAPAMAAPPVPAKAALVEAQDSVKVDVRHRGQVRIYRGFSHRRHIYRGFSHRHNIYRPHRYPGLSFGIVIGEPGYYSPGYYRPRYYDPYYVVRPRIYRRHIHRHAIRVGNPHVRWCYSRYRSYDRYSNTFQPYHGPRRICVSPYY